MQDQINEVHKALNPHLKQEQTQMDKDVEEFFRAYRKHNPRAKYREIKRAAEKKFNIKIR